ncbi:glycosyltransferase family 10 domain-containing protein [Helicobacter sp. 23-1046]
MKSKKQIELAITDWSDNSIFNKSNFRNNWIIQLLQKYLSDKYEFKWSDNPKYLIYNVFGDSYLEYSKDCVRICVAWENIAIDWNLADYGISTYLMDFGERCLSYPYYFLHKDDLRFALKKHLINDKRKKFCSFMVTNGDADKIRGEFFEKLCEYKKVDSGGRWKNNIGGPIGDRCGDFSTSKREWQKGYKFSLCFENSSQKGYVTEKILQAFSAGCVPIYWGDESLCDEKYARFRPVFNPKAFINVHNFDSIDSAIREIERIDNDNGAFEAMRKEPIFRAECLEEFLGAKFANEGGQNDIWSAENIEQTTQTIIYKSEKMFVDFFDNIFTKEEKQIKYGERLNIHFNERKYQAKKKKQREKRRKIERVIEYPFKKLRNYIRDKFRNSQ